MNLAEARWLDLPPRKAGREAKLEPNYSPFTVPSIVLSTMKPIILYTPDFIKWSASRACSRLWTCISSMTQGYQERFGELASFWPWPVIIFTKLLWLILHRSMTDEVNPVWELVSKHAHGGLCLCRVRLMFAWLHQAQHAKTNGHFQHFAGSSEIIWKHMYIAISLSFFRYLYHVFLWFKLMKSIPPLSLFTYIYVNVLLDVLTA